VLLAAVVPDKADEQEGAMDATKVEALKVPGASMYYEVHGSGPVLLCIPGGPADAGVFADIAGILADRYTVVTYDPRGNSRSTLDGPPEDQRVEVHSDDARRLLDAVGTEPAFVLGSSGGALIGLDLAARHPERVRTLVAHEPPALELLPDNARWRAFSQEVYETYRTEGVFPAMQKFGEGVGLEGSPDEPSPEAAVMMGRIMGNLEFFVAHVLRPVSGYVPDIAALRSTPTRIVVAGGEQSRAKPHPAYQATVALAERLGTEVVHFPGHHGGFGSHPSAFAETLHATLGAHHEGGQS
jgi:pimeloyl-ACP methyl ester carboxylesterase